MAARGAIIAGDASRLAINVTIPTAVAARKKNADSVLRRLFGKLSKKKMAELVSNLKELDTERRAELELVDVKSPRLKENIERIESDYCKEVRKVARAYFGDDAHAFWSTFTWFTVPTVACISFVYALPDIPLFLQIYGVPIIGLGAAIGGGRYLGRKLSNTIDSHHIKKEWEKIKKD